MLKGNCICGWVISFSFSLPLPLSPSPSSSPLPYPLSPPTPLTPPTAKITHQIKVNRQIFGENVVELVGKEESTGMVSGFLLFFSFLFLIFFLFLFFFFFFFFSFFFLFLFLFLFQGLGIPSIIAQCISLLESRYSHNFTIDVIYLFIYLFFSFFAEECTSLIYLFGVETQMFFLLSKEWFPLLSSRSPPFTHSLSLSLFSSFFLSFQISRGKIPDISPYCPYVVANLLEVF